MRRLVLGIVGALAVTFSACGGSSPAGPSTPPITTPPPTTTPPTPPPTSTGWTLSGRVVASGVGRAAANVRVVAGAGVSSVSAADGTFTLSSSVSPASTPQRLTLESPEFLPREVYVNLAPGLRENVSIDLISLQAPFSVAFYKSLVRNGYEQPSTLQPVRRWTTNPSVYVRSADQTGRAIEPEVMALVLATIPRAVSDWTDGALSVAQLESGPATRPEASGWITVNITRDYSSTFCGQARVGANPGSITLVNDRCNCGSVKIGADVVVHEVGHALGFWHVGDRSAVMYPQVTGGCPIGTLSASERYHAGLAYHRAPGNLDPDRDPIGAAFATEAETAAPTVSCFTRGRS